MTLLMSLRREGAGILTLVADHPRATLQVQLQHVELHPVVDHLERDALVLDERPAERHALRVVVGADLEALLGTAEAGGGHQHAGGVEAFHDVVEALALFAEQAVRGDLRVLVEPAAGGQTHAAHVLVDGPADAGKVGGDVDERETLVAGGRIGDDERAVTAGRAQLHALLGTGDVGLLAVQHVVAGRVLHGAVVLMLARSEPPPGSVVLMPTKALPAAAAGSTSSLAAAGCRTC